MPDIIDIFDVSGQYFYDEMTVLGKMWMRGLR